MKRDKEEFKARNREESFIKDKRPDIQLGRHAESPQEMQQVSRSKKNRMYQARQEYAEPVAVTAETPDTADSEMDFTVQEYLPENPQKQPDNDAQPEQTQADFPEFADSDQQERNADIPKPEPPTKTATQKNRLYQKHTKAAQKPVDLDIPQKKAEQPPDETDEPSPHTKADDYNIRDAVQDNQTEFSRNTDIDFSGTVADRDSNIPFDRVQTSGNDSAEQKPQGKGKRQRLVYDKAEKQPDGSSGTKAEQAGADSNNTAAGQPEGKAEKSEQAPSGDVPFDRAARFEKKAEKARAKADKVQQALPKKTKIKKQRLYDEQKKKAKTRLKFEKEVRPQSDLYHRSPIAPAKTAASYAGQDAKSKLHSKIAEVEHENSAVEAAHKTEQKTEALARYSVRTAKYIDGKRKAAPYQKAASSGTARKKRK